MTAAVANPPGIIPGLTAAWVRLYTSGMTNATRSRRRLEIESDLWEHYVDRSVAASPAATNVEMFGRLLRGIPSDIAWRFQAEGFQMNINIPLERLAGVLLLFLIIPFIAGVSISGYDVSREAWPDEFERFADMSSRQREITALLHGVIGMLLIAGAAQFFSMLRERSPRLVTLGAALLTTAGMIMLVNAAFYRAMSGVADDYVAGGDASLVATARSFAIAIEGLAMANLTATTAGILALSVALTRLAMVPKWTRWLPAAGIMCAVIWIAISPSFGDVAWAFMMLGLLSVALWLIVCGGWLLLGGATITGDADRRGTQPAA